MYRNRQKARTMKRKRDRLGAIADEPTDTAPDLASVVAARGVELEALGQQVRDLAEQVRRLENDLCAVEAALMDVRPEVES